MVNEFTELGERNIYDDGRRGTLTIAPLVGRADAVLLLNDLWSVRDRHSHRDIVLKDSADGGLA